MLWRMRAVPQKGAADASHGNQRHQPTVRLPQLLEGARGRTGGAALGIPTLDGLGADGKGAHAAYEQIYFSSLMPRTYLCARLLETLD
jgi:hypothetical protein